MSELSIQQKVKENMFLSVREMCTWLNVSRRTLYKIVKNNNISFVRAGIEYRYNPADFLNIKTTKRNPDRWKERPKPGELKSKTTKAPKEVEAVIEDPIDVNDKEDDYIGGRNPLEDLE